MNRSISKSESEGKSGRLINFHLHMPHAQIHHQGGGGRREARSVPKGCLAVTVGQGEEEQRRFVIPVAYVNHPLFTRLLKEAEDEYGFHQKGPINIPCHVEEFCYVRGLIDQETTSHHHQNHHHPHHQFLCFKLQELNDLVKNLDKVDSTDEGGEFKEYPHSPNEGTDHNDAIKTDDDKIITKDFEKTEEQELMSWSEEEEIISHLASPKKLCDFSSGGLFDQSSGTSNWWED